MNKNINRIIIIAIVATGIGFTVFKYRERSSEKDRLRKVYQDALILPHDRRNPFDVKSDLAYCDSMEQHAVLNNRQRNILEFCKADDYLKSGDERKVIAVLGPLDSAIVEGPDFPATLVKEIRNTHALAYLRLAERTNCVGGHTMASCVFPIKGAGIYTDLYASQKAINLYEQILQKDTGDLESRWLLNLAYMTIGRYPAGVPARWVVPGLDADTSSYRVKPFVNKAPELGLNAFQNEAGGTIVDDFNNDGYLDIVTSDWSLEHPMHFFRNNGDGTFSDLSKASGLSAIHGGLNIIQADYNNDGYTDILVLRGAWLQQFGNQPNTLLRNNGDGTFTDVTIESGLLSCSPTQTAVWADFNNDGWLDLFIGHETASPYEPNPSQLYINNHDGTFTDVAEEAGCKDLAFMKGVAASDYNNDGWPDIFISTLNGRKILLRNKAIKGSRVPHFENTTHAAGLDRDLTYTFPAWFWDYDNDGWPDIFTCGYQFKGSLATPAAEEALGRQVRNASRMYLYHNNHDGTFTNVSTEMGLDKPVFAMGSNFGDIDNDGWLDIYLGTGNPDYRSLVPNRLFKNINGKFFADVTTSARVGNLQKGHGVAFADLDNDGDQDIFVETGGAYDGDAYFNSLYVNPGYSENHWIGIRLEGVQSNRSAIGARLILSVTEEGVKRTLYREVGPGGSFGCSPLRREIGIGKAVSIDELVVQWPTSGRVQVFKNIPAGQFLHIKESSDHFDKVNLRSFDLQGSAANLMTECIPPHY